MADKVLILLDFNEEFWKTYDNWETSRSLDISSIKHILESNGFDVIITSYRRIDYTYDYCGYYVLYSSSEDLFGGTKDYMEDVLVWLIRSKAILIPSFEYFRAHHNKVMMELLRYSFQGSEMRSISSRTYRAMSDLRGADIVYPLVLKSAAGAGGARVFLINNETELYRIAEKASRIPSEKTYWYLKLAKFKRKILKRPDVYQLNNRKFILQEYIPDLTGDYKVLIFADHYFVLHRLNRENDFRASGSGRFIEPDESEIGRILDYARDYYVQLHVPQASLDIVCNEHSVHLIEYQCISFGFKAMSLSTYHYEYHSSEWRRIEGKVNAESEYANSIVSYIQAEKVYTCPTTDKKAELNK